MSTEYIGMACAKCGSPEGCCNEFWSLRSPFYVYLTRDFENHVTVPCHVRKSFNRGTGNVIEVETSDGHYYYFNINKYTGISTILRGSGYKTFVVEYDMRSGDKIKFHTMDEPQVISVWQETPNGEPKNRVEVEEEDEEHAPKIMFSSGFELNDNQQSRYNAIMIAFGTGVRVVYVHCLSKSDIDHSYLRIPKYITEAIKLADYEVAMLSLHRGVGMQAEFALCANGRTRFGNGWDQFARYYDLVHGMNVMMLFFTNNAMHVCIDFHVL